MDETVRFPDGFLFGAATSAYQVEGGASAAGRGTSIWDTFSHTPGMTRNGETGDRAADHYHRFAADVALMADLGIQMYRFSVAWPRVIPEGSGAVNPAGLDFYHRLVDELLGAGIEPLVTLFHWDLPQPLQDAGGWRSRATVDRFGEYAAAVHGALGDRVRWWGTINEPWCPAFLGHASGTHAPGVRDPAAAFAAAHHLLLAHGRAVAVMRAQRSANLFGIPLNPAPVHAADPDDPVVADGVRRFDAQRNRIWLDSILAGAYPADALEDAAPFGGYPVRPGDLAEISAPLDWLGVNYYHDFTLARAAEEHDGGETPGAVRTVEVVAGEQTDMGWPITPPGLYNLLVRLTRQYPGLPPVLVSENGCAYDDPPGPDGVIDDVRRIRFLDAHLRQIHRAVAAGVDVRGYLVWSLLDNFEWAEGYARRFGLVHVDFETLNRTPRRSAAWYRDVIARGGPAGPG